MSSEKERAVKPMEAQGPLFAQGLGVRAGFLDAEHLQPFRKPHGHFCRKPLPESFVC